MNFNRNLNIALVVLFLLVTGYVAVEVASLPAEVLRAVGITENTNIQRAERVALPVFIALGADFLIVLLLIFTFSNSQTSSIGEHIVYVERQSDEQKNEATHDEDAASLLTEKIQNTRQALEELAKDPSASLEKSFTLVCGQLSACVGALYKAEYGASRHIRFVAGYAFFVPESKPLSYEFGEGIAGQVALSGQTTQFDNVPEGYIQVHSGLGSATPKNLVALPLKTSKGTLVGVAEIGAFQAFSSYDLDFLEGISDLLVNQLN